MGDDALRGANMLGKQVTDSTKDIFSERARWIQTWITARALPFIALLTLALSYFQIGSGEIVVPRLWSLVVAGVLLFVVVLRAYPYISQRQWQMSFGNYQICLTFLGVLLLLGDSHGLHSLLYWGVLLAGFWGLGFIYPRKWTMPGEFAAIALMLTGVVIGANSPLPGWLFVLVMVAPVMVYLQWQHKLIKPVLFLAALLVGVLLHADIRGWLVVLAIAVALALIWVAVYSIGKLNQKEASSFIQSVGVGVISGLVFVIFVALLRFPLDEVLTWWMMFGVFAGIAALLYSRNGSKLFPLLMLWGTHWALITLSFSLDELLKPILHDELYGFQIAAILGGLLLRHLAFKLDNNRLLVWARIYLMLVAVTIGIKLPFRHTFLLHLIFILAVFAMAIWFARVENLAKGQPWWKGVVNPRHVVAVRRILRKGGSFIVSIPFIGATTSAIIKTVQVLAKLKRGGQSLHSGDVLLILWVICLAFFISKYIDAYVLSTGIAKTVALGNGHTGVSDTKIAEQVITDARKMMEAQSSYLIAGLLFGIIAIKERQPLYPLLAMVSFLLAPATMLNGEYVESAFFWLISLIAATGILSVRELSKQPSG